MSLQSLHEDKAAHNAKLYSSLNSSEYPDWVVVVLFYQGVHLIESILDIKGEHSESHLKRNEYMNDYVELFPRQIKIDYRELERLSRQARYKPEYEITEENLKTAFSCIESIKNWHTETKNKLCAT